MCFDFSSPAVGGSYPIEIVTIRPPTIQHNSTHGLSAQIHQCC